MAERRSTSTCGERGSGTPRWRPSLPWVLNVVAFNEALAVPIALIDIASGNDWTKSLIGASVYTQHVGGLCFLGGSLMEGRFESLSGPRRIAIGLSINFALAVIGGVVAGVVLTIVFGYLMSRDALLFNAATAASVATVVGIGRVTSTRLKIALEVSEQSLRERELAEERLLKAKSEAELAALQARINPHFLFNTLNSIAALIGDDPVKAEQLLGQLSSLMRYALQANPAGVARVDDELRIVRGYLDIEQVRLGDRLRYEIDVDPRLRGAELPVLLLQPLVENAIKHGIAPKVAGGRVTVRAWCDGDSAIFAIEDDGDGRERETAGMGEGLANVRQRLEALYGNRASLSLTRHNGQTETRVTLPIVLSGAVSSSGSSSAGAPSGAPSAAASAITSAGDDPPAIASAGDDPQ